MISKCLTDHQRDLQIMITLLSDVAIFVLVQFTFASRSGAVYTHESTCRISDAPLVGCGDPPGSVGQRAILRYAIVDTCTWVGTSVAASASELSAYLASASAAMLQFGGS